MRELFVALWLLVVLAILFLCTALLIAQETADKPKLHFLYFGAEWCQPCKRMKATTFADAKVKAKLETLDVTILDFDLFKTVARDYKVTAVPTYLLIDADRVILRKATGYKPPAEFLRWLDGP